MVSIDIRPSRRPTLRETTGERLRRLRLARGWTQAQLAERAGIRPLTISRAEGDHDMYAHTLDALATALGVDMTYLWNGKTR